MISELSLLRRKSSEGKTPFLSSSDRSSELLIFPLQQLTTCSLSILNLERTRASGPVPNFQAKVMEAPRAEPGGKLCLLSARQHARHSALPCLTLEFFCKMGVVIPLLQLKKLNSKAGCLFSHTASSLVRFHQLLSWVGWDSKLCSLCQVLLKALWTLTYCPFTGNRCCGSPKVMEWVEDSGIYYRTIIPEGTSVFICTHR